ncbi:MAG: T9SS type A sorting domain-containing protein [Bacteroidia bacterium]
MKKIITCLSALFLLCAIQLTANVYPVTTNTGANIAGSFANAIVLANGSPGMDTITFTIGSGMQTIHPLATLNITERVFINGTSQPGYAGEPLIQVKGDSLGVNSIMTVASDGNCLIRGLVFTKGKDAGLTLNAPKNTIQNCWFGLDSTGITSDSLLFGIQISADSNYIGGTTVAERCVLAGSQLQDIRMVGSENYITGNYIGLNKTGMAAAAVYTGALGIYHYGAGSKNHIGIPGAGNYISGYALGKGIELDGGSSRDYVQANKVGLLANDIDSLPNQNGIRLDFSSSGHIIGGYLAGEGNYVCGNSSGIVLYGSDSCYVWGNSLGYAPGGLFKPNGYAIIINSANKNIIGGTVPGKRNTMVCGISGGCIGIYGTSSFNRVIGNYIGLDPTGNAGSPGGGGAGIGISSSGRGNVIGGADSTYGNVVSDMSYGFSVSIGSQVYIQHNLIGTNASGTAPVPNVIGITTYQGVDSVFIENNVISGNSNRAIDKNDYPGVVFIRGNKIGTDYSGTVAIPNAVGIRSLSRTIIGGSNPQDRNIITANPSGITMEGDSIIVKGNYIGVDINKNPMGNGNSIEVVAGVSNSIIGGLNPADKNIIAYGSTGGIVLLDPLKPKVRILGNEMYKNPVGSSSIDILQSSTSGYNANDIGEADSLTYGNRGQNHPDIQCVSLRTDGTGFNVAYGLDSKPNHPYLFEFYADSLGQYTYGQGQYFLLRKLVMSNGSGTVTDTVFIPFSAVNGFELTVSVTDTLEGVTSEFAMTKQPIGVSLVPSNPVCGSANGIITPFVTGGTPGYSYYWSTGATTTNLTGVPAGQYFLEVRDVFGCYASDGMNLGDSNGPAVSANSITPVSCAGLNDGAIDINVSGGALPYTILWSTNASTEDISGLIGGPYDVSVTDNAGCHATLVVNVPEPQAFSFTSSATVPSSCGAANGSVSVMVAGGTAPLSFLWDSGAASQTANTATNIAQGIYQLLVTDVNNCKDSTLFALSDPGAPVAAVDSFRNAGCILNGGNGAIYTTTAGAGPYSYLWTNAMNTDDITGLGIGTFGLTVTDLNSGCKGSLAQRITGERPGTAQICMLTVDTATNRNMVVWNDSVQGIALYEIFRESSVAGNFNLIATIPAGITNTYEDTLANADIKPWRYLIRTTDSCNRVSTYSLAQKTIHCNVNLNPTAGFDVSWDQYQGTNVDFTHYLVFRKLQDSVSWRLIDSVLATAPLYYNDISSPVPTDTNYYFVEINANENCASNLRLQGPANGIFTSVTKSRSNIKNNRIAGPTGMASNHLAADFILYPNPASDELFLKLPSDIKEGALEIRDITGRLLLRERVSASVQRISTAELSNGVYLLTIVTGKSGIVKKLVVEK